MIIISRSTTKGCTDDSFLGCPELVRGCVPLSCEMRFPSAGPYKGSRSATVGRSIIIIVILILYYNNNYYYYYYDDYYYY